MAENDQYLDRYRRQIRFAPLGEDGQRRLLASRVLVCGCGALGSVAADLLVRAGVVGAFNIRANPSATSVNGQGVSGMPAGLCVALGDRIVVHIPPPDDIVAPTSETLAKNEHLAAT